MLTEEEKRAWLDKLDGAAAKTQAAFEEQRALWKEMASLPGVREELALPFWAEPKPTIEVAMPIEVRGIAPRQAGAPGVQHRGADVGKTVSVRLAGDDQKTYAGVYLGDLPLNLGFRYHRDTKILEPYTVSNPAMWVPELGRVVWGAESWWALERDKAVPLPPVDLKKSIGELLTEGQRVTDILAALTQSPQRPITDETIAGAVDAYAKIAQKLVDEALGQKPRKITGEELSNLLSLELEAGDWGDIDPWWFKPYRVEDYDDVDAVDEDSDEKHHRSLQAICRSVAAKLTERLGG